MKHSRHIERVALGQTVSLWLKANPGKPFKQVAQECGATTRRCRGALDYFAKHGDEPCCAEWGGLRHEDIVALGVRGLASLRAALIRNFSANNGLSKPKVEMSNREIREMAATCGLETFRHKGKVLIHWRHV